VEGGTALQDELLTAGSVENLSNARSVYDRGRKEDSLGCSVDRENYNANNAELLR